MQRLLLLLALFSALARPCLAGPDITGEYRTGQDESWTHSIALAENSDKCLLSIFRPGGSRFLLGTWSFDGRKTLTVRYLGLTETLELGEHRLPQGTATGLRRTGAVPEGSLLPSEVLWKQPVGRFLTPSAREFQQGLRPGL